MGVFSLFMGLMLIMLVGLAAYDVSPGEAWDSLTGDDEDGDDGPLPSGNEGIHDSLESIEPAFSWEPGDDVVDFQHALRPALVDVLGVHAVYDNGNLVLMDGNGSIAVAPDLEVNGEWKETDGVDHRKMELLGYDGVHIPVMQFLPTGFDVSSNKTLPTIIVFSGHGGYDQVNFQEDSYQRAAALRLAKAGYMVFSMENRGMGVLSGLGDHLDIDASARLLGGSWYGEIITDALYLVESVHHQDGVNVSSIGVAGVSTGGALSMFTASLDGRISASYIQGYFGSYRTTFGVDTHHCTCNHISGILSVADMSDIAGAIAPRDLLIVNGLDDTFSHDDAEAEFPGVLAIFNTTGASGNVGLETPDVGHEFSVGVAREFFDGVW